MGARQAMHAGGVCDHAGTSAFTVLHVHARVDSHCSYATTDHRPVSTTHPSHSLPQSRKWRLPLLLLHNPPHHRLHHHPPSATPTPDPPSVPLRTPTQVQIADMQVRVCGRACTHRYVDQQVNRLVVLQLQTLAPPLPHAFKPHRTTRLRTVSLPSLSVSHFVISFCSLPATALLHHHTPAWHS
jgi:hypothetical protein